MKKRYVLLAALLALSVVAAGCGKKKDEVPQQVPVTATPTPEAAQKNNLVDMQTSKDETSGIKNILGQESPTAAKFVMINKTGADVASVYIRPHTEDEEDDYWGEDLVNGKFVLKDGDKALYYYEKGAKDANGNTVSTYDIKIEYTDEDRYECFFRKLPFASITQLTLRMDGETELPFATYASGTGTKEISTLNEVKKRVGWDDEESQTTADDNNSSSDSEDNTQPDPTQTPSENPEDPGTDEQDPGTGTGADNPGGEDPVSVAEGYIGRSLDDLKGACGDPTGSDYQDEPETGKTGYHYYSIGDSTFTVSTTVDENGNEIVAGVW